MLRVPIELLNHRSSMMIRSLIVSFRLVVITYVAVVAIDIAATATIVSKRLLKTGVIPRFPDRNSLFFFNVYLTFFKYPARKRGALILAIPNYGNQYCWKVILGF